MQERSKRTRQRILDAALKEFSLKGLHGARVDVIAARADANKQRIYAYFGDKQRLFQEVLKSNFAELLAEEAALLKLLDNDIPQLAERILRHGLSFHERHPHFWRLIAWENLEGGKHVPRFRGIKDQTYQHLKQLYRKGQRQGSHPKTVSFEAFIFTLWSLSFFYHSNQRTMTRTLKLDLSARRVKDKLVSEILEMVGGNGNDSRTFSVGPV